GDRLQRARRDVHGRVVDGVGVTEAGRRVGGRDHRAFDRGVDARVALRRAAAADVVAALVGLHGAADVGQLAAAAAAGDQVAAAVAGRAAVVAELLARLGRASR